jgi:uncharacterized protein (TIGR03118 family)
MHIYSHSRSWAATAGTVVVAAVIASIGATPVHANSAVAGDQFRAVRLVSDIPGAAHITDPNLVNAWGLAASPTSPLWVANNGTSTSTLYRGVTPGTPISPVPLVVSIPGGGAPTGMVFNPTDTFGLSTDGKTGPALFIFAGEDGDLSAWNQSGDITKATLVQHLDGAIFKGLTMVTTGDGHFLLATDFHNNRIVMFNDQFAPVDRPNAFRSTGIPDGYAPFNVANLDGRVYVTYAKQDAAGEDDVAGPGHGFINVFTQSGRFLSSLVRRGPLDSPWGLAIGPKGFGPFAGKLLVGNFGDGRIHVVNAGSGRVVATLRNGAGRPISIDGLWSLYPGNGTAGNRSDVWFSAGPDDEAHGLLGVLRHR